VTFRRLPSLAFLAAIAAGVPGGALRAQSFAELCRTIRIVRLGQWASYKVTGRSDASTIRLAIVGSEPVGDSTYYWYEITTAGPAPQRPDDRRVFQMLIAGLGTARPDVRGLVMKTGDQPAIRVPDLLVTAMHDQVSRSVASETVRYCSNGEVVGQETVRVPAGSFKTLHVRSAAGDAWISHDVPFGLVRVRGADGSEMVLLGSGMDATSSITERPRPGFPGAP
jgi:hypothetical protein